MKLIFKTKKNDLLISIFQTNSDMGLAAAEEARDVIQKAIEVRMCANIIIATGNSQLTFLDALSQSGGIVPEPRKAEIVYQTLTGPVDQLCPASILRQAVHAHLFLDAESGRWVSAP